MRNVIIIIVLLFQGIPLFASQGGALLSDENCITTVTEEITASWELKSDTELMGERVLADFRGRKDNGISLNAFCSAESIEKLAVLRKLAGDIIASSIKSGLTGSETLIAAALLKELAAVSFTSLTLIETDLVASAENSSLIDDNFKNEGFSAGGFPKPEYAVSSQIITCIAGSVLKLKISRNRINEKTLSIEKLLCSKERFDTDFTDLYRLFLYVRDNSGNGRSCYITYNNVSLLLDPFPFNSTINKNTSAAKTEILQSGASS